MIKRTIKETVTEYDKDGRVIKETVTETTEDDDTTHWPYAPSWPGNSQIVYDNTCSTSRSKGELNAEGRGI